MSSNNKVATATNLAGAAGDSHQHVVPMTTNSEIGAQFTDDVLTPRAGTPVTTIRSSRSNISWSDSLGAGSTGSSTSASTGSMPHQLMNSSVEVRLLYGEAPWSPLNPRVRAHEKPKFDKVPDDSSSKANTARSGVSSVINDATIASSATSFE